MSLRFGVYGTSRESISAEVLTSLGSHPAVEEVFFHKELAEGLDGVGYSLEELKSLDLDFMMTIGGDGTILRLLQKCDMPVLGVNTGTVGFLTSTEVNDVDQALDRIEEESFFIDDRLRLKVYLNGEEKGDSTNEVVVHSNQIAKIRGFKVSQGDVELDKFRADGLIVATPTGSTSYAMSAGGPIVDPSVEAFVMVPISPYELATKPYVVPVDKKVKVELTEKDKPCLMVLDGQKEFEVKSEDIVEVEVSETRSKFIKFEKDFYERVKKKLISND